MPPNLQLIVISDSVLSNHIGKKFDESDIPVVIWESSLFDDMRMTGSKAKKDYSQDGSDYDCDSVLITSPHPIANRMSGRVQIYQSSKSKLSWAVPAPGANIIAYVPGKPQKASVFCYERGSKMIKGTAPARRVGLCLSKKSLSQLTDEGLKLFDGAILWALQDKSVKK